MDRPLTDSEISADPLAVPTSPDDRQPPPDRRVMTFGGFSICPQARALRHFHEPVALGSRAFDLLVVLLRSRGQLVTKDQIVKEVWPSTYVDESNLRFQMGVLRKALGTERDRIKTIPGRGYIFVDDDAGMPAVEPERPTAALPASAKQKLPSERLIFIIEPDAEERNAMTALLRALKISVLGFRSVEEVAAFTVAPLRLVAG